MDSEGERESERNRESCGIREQLHLARAGHVHGVWEVGPVHRRVPELLLEHLVRLVPANRISGDAVSRNVLFRGSFFRSECNEGWGMSC
jgi:hypothetical protein